MTFTQPDLRSSQYHYVTYGVEGTAGTESTATGAGIVRVRVDRDNTDLQWMTQSTPIVGATGDLAPLVDHVTVNPFAQVRLMTPLYIQELKDLHAQGGILGGASNAWQPLQPPSSLSFWEGDGLEENAYIGCQLISYDLDVRSAGGASGANRQASEVRLTWNFVGSSQTTHAYTNGAPGSGCHPGTFPATASRDRPMVLSHLKKATFRLPNTDVVGTSSVNMLIDQLRLTVNTGVRPIFYQRGDGKNLISGFYQEAPTVRASIRRNWNDKSEKAKFLQTCRAGAGGPMIFEFEDAECNSGHVLSFQLTQANYVDPRTVDHRVGQPFYEALTFEGERSDAGVSTFHDILLVKYS